jgi:RNA methyltransferase, TrmH family
MVTDQHISKPKLKFAKDLSQKKVRSAKSLFIIEGWRAIEDACKAGMRAQMFLYTPAAKANASYAALFASVLRMANESYEISEYELSTVADTVTSQGVALILPQFDDSLERVLAGADEEKERIIVALDRISEPGNAGTIIRSADWFGADAVLMSEESVELYNPKLVRSTMGSLFHIPVIECGKNGASALRFADALALCRDSGFTLYGTDVKTEADIRTIRWARKSLIIIGSEARGLSDSVSALVDECVTIPKFGKAESLNAGSAAAIILGLARLGKP